MATHRQASTDADFIADVPKTGTGVSTMAGFG